jgi:tetrahydromethanopterin S-methyltransferase subunit E
LLTWRAKFGPGVPLGLLFVGLVVALDGWLLNRLVGQVIGDQEIGFLSFVGGLVVLASFPLLAALV